MAQSKQQPVQSTDRAGMFVLIVGAVVLTLGLLLLLGTYTQPTAVSLTQLKYTALGLGGVLAFLLPLLVIWLGVLLCVSAKRRVSFRACLLSWGMFLVLGAFLTLITTIQGNGMLMTYIGQLNQSFSTFKEPFSFGAYLSAAFARFGGRILPLPGGGVLGMILAYPLYSLLGLVGSITLLVLLGVAFLLMLVRLNPVLMAQRMRERMHEAEVRRARSAPMPRPEQAQAVQPAAQEEAPYMADGLQQAAAAPPPVEETYEYPEFDDRPPESLLGKLFHPQAMFNPEPNEGFQPLHPSMEEVARQTEAWSQAEKIRRSMAAKPQPAEAQQPAEKPAPYARRDVRESAAPKAEEAAARIEPVYAVPAYTTPGPTEPVCVEPASAEPLDIPSVDPQPSYGAKQEDCNETEQEAPAFVVPSAVRQPVPQAQRDVLPWEEAETAPMAQAPVYPAQAAALPSSERQEEWADGADSWQGGPEEEEPAFAPVQTSGGVRRAAIVHTDAAISFDERIPITSGGSHGLNLSVDGSVNHGPEHAAMRQPTKPYTYPTWQLLSAPPKENVVDHSEEDARRADKLIQTLQAFSIPASVHEIVHGPAITRFAIRLGEGVNVNKLRNVMDNLSVELLAKSPVRAEIPIPGTPLIGIEVSNEKSTTVYLSEVLDSIRMQESKSPTTVALGKDIGGTPILCDLMDMPHLLIAGATGSGKSVCINSIITSLLYRASPEEVRLILVDPKFVELQPYNDCPHLLLPVISDDKKVVAALEWLCEEMDERYRKMQKYNVRNLDGYNARVENREDRMPRIVMIIDEMADLIATCGKVVDEYVKRITAKARAAGICLILATQRPSVNVITGVIKANIPSRIAFQVSSQVDSRTILDAIGAERLLGYGDMLYMPRNLPAPVRVQGCFISDRDVEAITAYVKAHNPPVYNKAIMEYLDKATRQDEVFTFGGEDEGGIEVFDDLLPDAIEMAVEAGQMSISMLQRVLRVGYGRAGRLIDEMERRGIISESEGTKPRKTLLSREEHSRLVEENSPRLR